MPGLYLNAYAPFLLLSFSPWVSPAAALVMGIVLSLGFQFTFPRKYVSLGKWLLQIAIVLLGFSLQPEAVLKAGVKGIGLTLVSLSLTLFLGAWIGRKFKLPSKIATLISVGTAICGGSAIAAVGPTIEADAEEMSLSFGIVFLLNSLALLIFPSIGHWLKMSGESFGYFAAIAIHDTSSVVGAAARFGEGAVPVALAIKLTRALWIVPVSIAFVYFGSGKLGRSKAKLPWFIPVFVLAVIFRAVFPSFTASYSVLGMCGRAGLTAAIFLVSSQMTRGGLKRIGLAPLAFAVSLWLFVIALSLISLRLNWV